MMLGAAASLASSFMGSKGGSSSSTSSSSETNTTTHNSTSKGTEQSKAAANSILSSLLSDLSSAGTGYDKQSAVNDAQDAAKAASSAILAQAVPAAILGQNVAGGYSSSATKRATEDAAARASAAYASVITDNINKYASIANTQKTTDLSGLSSVLGLIQDSASTSDGTSNSTTKSSSTTTSSESKGGMGMSKDGASSIISAGMSMFGM